MTSTEHTISNNHSSTTSSTASISAGPLMRPNHSRQSSSSSSISSNSSKPRKILSPNIPARKTSNSTSASPSASAPGTPQNLPWMNSANKPTAAGIAQALQERARQIREKEEELARLQASEGTAGSADGEKPSSSESSVDSDTTATPITSGETTGNDDALAPSMSRRDSLSQNSEHASEASTPKANLTTLPRTNPTSPTTAVPRSPLRDQASQVESSATMNGRPISTSSTASRYSATGWDDYNGLVQAMDWGEGGGGKDGLGEIVIGGPQKPNSSVKSSPGIPADEDESDVEKERSRTPTLRHSSNPSTSSSSSVTSSNQHIRQHEQPSRLLDSYPISLPQTPSRSPDPDSISVADTDMQDYADLVDDNEEGGSAVQLMTATKMPHPSPQSATLVGQTPSRSGNIARTLDLSPSSATQTQLPQNPALVGMVGLGLGMESKGSPSTSTASENMISKGDNGAIPEAVTANLSSPIPTQSSEKSDRPSTAGSQGSFGTAKTSFSPSLQHHNETPPIGLGLGSPVTLSNGHTVTSPSTENVEVSPETVLSPSTSTFASATPLSETSMSSGGLSPGRRKSRPTALKLSGSTNALNSASPSPSAAGGAFTSSRSLASIASPKARNNHPPPTNPPAEPLPPLPPTPSLRQNNKGSIGSGSGIIGTLSPSTSSPQNQFNNPSRFNTSSSEGQQHQQKAESPRRSSASALHSPSSLMSTGNESTASSIKTHSRSQSQSAAAAAKNHAVTDAAASHAHAVLKAVETPLTFNEKSQRREIGLIAGNGVLKGEEPSSQIGDAMLALSAGNRDSLDSSLTMEEIDAKNAAGESEDSEEDSEGEADEAEVAVLKTLTHAPVGPSVDGGRIEKSSDPPSEASVPRSLSGRVAIPVGRATVTRVNSKLAVSPNVKASSESLTDSESMKPPRASLENLGNSRIVREATQRLNGSQRDPSVGDGGSRNAERGRDGEARSSVTVGQVPGPRRPVVHSWAQESASIEEPNASLSAALSHQPSSSTSSSDQFSSSSNVDSSQTDNRRSVIAQPGSWPASASNTDTSRPTTPAAVATLDDRSDGPLELALDEASENHVTADTVMAKPPSAAHISDSVTSSAGASAGNGVQSSHNAKANKPPMVRRRSSAASLMSNRRLEMEEDRNRAASTQSLDPLTLKRTEGRFTGAFGETVKAFKQLQAEKRALERVIRETTPLEGLGDGEGLGRYLQSISDKLRMSSSEIAQLLQLLEQQRAVMDYMLETHELERDQLLDEIDDLRDAMLQLESVATTHKSNAEKLTEDLEKAFGEGVAARAETLKAKAATKEQETKLNQLLETLSAEREKFSDLETKHREMQQDHETTRSHVLVADDKSRAEVVRLESEKDYLSRSHEKSVKELLAKHSDELKQLNSRHDKALADHKKQVEKDAEELKTSHEKDLEDFAEHVTELEQQINAHVEEKSQLFVEIESRKLQVANMNQQLQKAFAELAERGNEDSVNRSQVSKDRKSLESQVELHLKEKKGLEEKIAQLNALHQSRLNELFEEKETLKRSHDSEKSDLQLVIDSKMQEFAGIREEAANVKASHANDAEELEAIRESHERLEAEKDVLIERLKARDEELDRLSKQQEGSTLAAASSPAALSPPDLTSGEREERSSISSDRSDQAFTAAERKELLATLAEQRSRETQIRTAYKQLRDELRKTQAAAAQQNKRNTGSFISFGGPNAPLVSPALSSGTYPMSDGGHGGMPPSPGQSSLLNQGVGSGGGGTSRQLKRLSLPLVQTKPRNGNGPVAWQDLFRPDSAASTPSNVYQAPPSSYQYRSGSISSGTSLSGLHSSALHSKNNSANGIEGVSSSPEPGFHSESEETMRNRLDLNDSPQEERESEREGSEGIESLRSPALSHSSLEH